MHWDILDTGSASAQKNMEIDQKLLDQIHTKNNPILHFYDWEKPSLTVGYFIQPEKLLNLEALKHRGMDWARRPTGGGVVFHLWDLAFSILIPAASSLFSTETLKNYYMINQVVKQVIQDFFGIQSYLTQDDPITQDSHSRFFCMAQATKYDVHIPSVSKNMGSKKVVGAAQRKTKSGFLHQGTIALAFPDSHLLEETILLGSVREAILATTPTLISNTSFLKKTRNELRNLLTQHFSKL